MYQKSSYSRTCKPPRVPCQISPLGKAGEAGYTTNLQPKTSPDNKTQKPTQTHRSRCAKQTLTSTTRKKETKQPNQKREDKLHQAPENKAHHALSRTKKIWQTPEKPTEKQKIDKCLMYLS
jgi:hypothetical protein